MSAENTRRSLLGRLAALGITAPTVAQAAPEERGVYLTASELAVLVRAVEELGRQAEWNRDMRAFLGQLAEGDLGGARQTMESMAAKIDVLERVA